MAAVGLLANARSAIAQSLKVPQPEELAQLLRNPAQIEKIALGTSALRTLLLFGLSREKEQKEDLWHRDEEKFFATLRQLRDPKAQISVARLLEAKDPRAYSPAIDQKALPVVKKMEEYLGKSGLPPGSPLSADLLTSFLQANRFLVAASTENDSWYCRIYPLSVFCG